MSKDDLSVQNMQTLQTKAVIPENVMQCWRQTLAQCECCTRHMSNRSNSEASKLTKVYIGNEYCQGQCLCPCRHYARILETACEKKKKKHTFKCDYHSFGIKSVSTLFSFFIVYNFKINNL